MILKNIINNFSIISLLSILLFIYIINYFFVTSNVRNKFFLFLVNLLIFIGIGLFYNLDGLVMIFFISELTIILIFVILFSQIYSHYKQKYTNFKFIFAILIVIMNCGYYEVGITGYKNFYVYSNIVLNDFYYIYNSYFEKQILLTVFTLLIITLYSIFFILLHYLLKQSLYSESKKRRGLFLLRKQNLIHQNNYNTKIRLFKKNN